MRDVLEPIIAVYLHEDSSAKFDIGLEFDEAVSVYRRLDP